MPSPPTQGPTGEPAPTRGLGASLMLVAASVTVPLLVVLAVGESLAMYVDGPSFSAVVGGGFALVAWGAVERYDLDRPNLVVAALVVPFGAFVLLPFLAVVGAEPVRVVLRFLDPGYRAGAVEGLFLYAFAHAAGGVLGVWLTSRLRRRAATSDRYPDPSTALGVVVGVLVVTAALGVGANHVAASGSTVTTVEPGRDRVGTAFLNVTVEGPAAERRVTVTAPGGWRVTKRVPRSATRNGAATVGVPLWLGSRANTAAAVSDGYLPYLNGTYRVRVTTLAGLTVDTATMTVDESSSFELTEVVVGRGDLQWEDRPDELDSMPPSDAVSVGVGIADSADRPFASQYAVTVRAGDRVFWESREAIWPGEHVGIVLPLDDADVRAIHREHGGVATVELSRNGRVVRTVQVEVPELT